MKNLGRVRWLSKFDMEPLLSSILTAGMFISVGLMGAGWVIARTVARTDPGYRIQAISIPRLIQADLHRFGSTDFWFRFLIDLGFAILLITPYARLVATWLYLAFVKHRWRYAVYTSIVLVLLGMVLFSDIVLAPGLGQLSMRQFLSRP